MPARVQLVVPIALALLLPVGPAAPALGADEGPIAARSAAEPGSNAPGALAQAAPPQTQQPAKPEQAAAKTQEQPAPQPATAAFGPAWRSSSTGRQIPDPTGTRFFRPAVSGGAGVVAR